MKGISKIIKEARNSSFNKQHYQINLFIHMFKSEMLRSVCHDKYMEYEKNKNLQDITSKDVLSNAIPGFQRDNNKWSVEMQTKFMENILSGASSIIQLFYVNPGDEIDIEDCMIIDGLQRTTAILKFLDGELFPFGIDIKECGMTQVKRFLIFKLHLQTYTFKTWEEVGKFYIDMNQYITHSDEDIQKAKDWFLKEKNIIL